MTLKFMTPHERLSRPLVSHTTRWGTSNGPWWWWWYETAGVVRVQGNVVVRLHALTQFFQFFLQFFLSFLRFFVTCAFIGCRRSRLARYFHCCGEYVCGGGPLQR